MPSERRPMQLQQILFSQGFGTRRVCAGLVEQGFVTVQGEPCADPYADFEPDGLRFTVQGRDWAYHDKAYLDAAQTRRLRVLAEAVAPGPASTRCCRRRCASVRSDRASRACRRSAGSTRTRPACCC